MTTVSVCIATFNGEQFITEQLESILVQLADDDEVVISDDSSTDDTLSRVQKFADHRIKLFQNNQFQNPIYNFEFSLSQSKGDIIFFSDQDDLWMPEKVPIILDIFNRYPDITLIASNANIINDLGEVIKNSFYNQNFKFTDSILLNIVKNRFLGCTLAFRRNTLRFILPFPKKIPMHDCWLGITNRLFGKIYYIDTPLISYRRHTSNFSPSSPSNIFQVLSWRWHLVVAVLCRYLDYQKIVKSR